MWTQVPGADDVIDEAPGGVGGADAAMQRESTESEERENTERAESCEVEEGDGPADVVRSSHTDITAGFINRFWGVLKSKVLDQLGDQYKKEAESASEACRESWTAYCQSAGTLTVKRL